MQKQTVTIINKRGLHARAASKLANTAAAFTCQISIEKDQQTADAKSIMQVMMLAACKGTDITVCCDGADEEPALHTVLTLINNRFDEDE